MKNSSHNHVPARNLMKILWGALTASHIVLAITAYFKDDLVLISDTGDQLLQFLIPVGIILIVLSYLVPHFMIKNFKKPSSKKLFNPEGILYAPFILSLALNELCAFMGYVAKVIYGGEQTAIILFTVAIIAILTKYPSEDKINRQIEALKRQP